ncbi:MAG: 16S rRNA (guanine(527)-N(7))-methyltransferase RsmG [Alcanivorax sp.]|nr:16S rRNA (guanine(527)-N(7))-methyltransferase RsmG [Alcanivorax sp.]
MTGTDLSVDPHLADRLASGIAELGLGDTVDAAQQQLLLRYVALLHKWNKAFNLTAVRDPQEMVTRHILDALSVLPHLAPLATLDVGTGAGVPGIPLAIVRPDIPFTLLDSNGKKTRFVRQAALELGLTNVEVVQARVEQYRKASPQVISRAFASLPDMLRLLGHLLAEGGRLLAMKAVAADDEVAALAQLPAGLSGPQWQVDIHRLVVPGLDGTRQLVMIQPQGETQ